MSLEAAKILKEDQIDLAVVNMCSIKPIDKKAIESWKSKVSVIFTAEDHNIVGGLGSAVANVMAETPCPARLVKIGVPDTFGESGSPQSLYEKYGLDAIGISRTIKSHLAC